MTCLMRENSFRILTYGCIFPLLPFRSRFSSFLNIFFPRKAMGRLYDIISMYQERRKEQRMCSSFLHEHKIIIFGMMKKIQKRFSHLLTFISSSCPSSSWASIFPHRATTIFFPLLNDDGDCVGRSSVYIWVSEWEGTIEGKKIIFHIHNHQWWWSSSTS